MPSVLSSRNDSKNKKEFFSPTVIKRGGIHNDNNLFMIFSGLNINKNINSTFQDNQRKTKNNSNGKMKMNTTTNPLISDKNPINAFSQISNNGGNKITNNINSNSNNLNKSTDKVSIFIFDLNFKIPFNTNINNKRNPFSFQPVNNNNITKSNHIFTQ